MENHSEKRRDMCRSILPSTRRKGAADDLAAWKRNHRRTIRHQIHDAMGYDWLDYEGTTLDVDTNRPVKGGHGWGRIITHLVDERRNADKIHPLRRWVEAIKDDLPGEDDEQKWAALRTWLPQNLIGRHAMSHVEDLFDLPDRWDRFRYYGSNETKEERLARWARENETWRALVRTAVETRHKEFNSATCDPCLGLHDVDRWCRMNPARDHQTWVLKILGATA